MGGVWGQWSGAWEALANGDALADVLGGAGDDVARLASSGEGTGAGKRRGRVGGSLSSLRRLRWKPPKLPPKQPHPCHERDRPSQGEQMKEDAKILTADTSFMDDDAKAWFKLARSRIMKEMMDKQAAEPTILAVEQPSATSTTPSSAVINELPTSSI
ncbi:hypothetical protein QYE76_044354 [Lolium multiflorum]|uniref:Uncharacterized protein n=1 Tax=Lolium multiflorum TaxID=4521 RepID=A0AAD8WYS3_LOLMU|nr:hypothetical protein QYE76_044354 [Lolium multiflorum]